MHRAYFHIPLLRENYTYIIDYSEGCGSGDSFCDVLKRHRAPSYTGRTRGFEKGLGNSRCPNQKADIPWRQSNGRGFRTPMFSLDAAVFITVTYHITVNWLRYLLVNTALPSRFEIHQQFISKARGMPTPDVLPKSPVVEGGYVLKFLELA